MRFLPVSQTVLLVELADLDETLSLFASLKADPLHGVVDIVPAARTLMIRFQPTEMTAQELAGKISTRDLSYRMPPSERLVEISVRYDGEDLGDVAELTGLSVGEIIRRHTESTFTVAFCGFAPGFGYLVGGDPALHVPRRQSPRTKIPAGSVALAGAFSGVYPQASPGGWQIIGTTNEAMWDLSRDPPALLAPGDQVRFRNIETKTVSRPRTASRQQIQEAPASPAGKPAFKILTAPLPALFQDLGRFGQTGQGVSSAGALDRGALKAANRVVGNPPGIPCLEIIPGGFSVEVFARLVVAITGADCAITLRDSLGRSHDVSTYAPISLEPGDVVTLGHARRGTRVYMAVRGGFAVQSVLGSSSTDTLAVLGPEPVTAGAILKLVHDSTNLTSVALNESPAFKNPVAGQIVTLDVIMGPRSDWFTEAGVAALSKQLWQVTPQSNRVGIRLSGELPLERVDNTELPSEGTECGAIQVPHSGQPVLFLADHPLTGGYPVIGTVADYHLDLAGQIPVNAQIRFRPVTTFADVQPLGGRHG